MRNKFATLTTEDGDNVVLRSVQARGQLDGLLLSMTLRQVFRNDEAENLEVTYTFPLAWGAVLMGLEATLGGKRMTGQVMACSQARERYEEAIEDGDAPIMVEKAYGGVFNVALGSLKPGEEAVIEITYAQLLSFEPGRIRLVIPTTIAPRFGDAQVQGGLQPDQVPEPDLLASQGFGLTLTLQGPVSQARIESPSHTVTQQREGDSVTVTLQGAAWLDRDFVLLLEGLAGQSLAVAGPDPLSGEGHTALIASYCPPPLPPRPSGPASPLRLKILVDCSGSMAGDSLRQAQRALHELAQHLTAGDQVSYSRFGSVPHRVLPPQAVNADVLRALAKAIGETQADLGGTGLEDALTDTFALEMAHSANSEEADVLLITDGAVWDARHIVEAARRSGHRIYALGVGSAPAESLLRELADATGGASEFVTPNEDMANAMKALLARVRLAVAVRAQLQMDASALWSSPLPRRLNGGETVHVLLRLPARPEQAPALELDEAAPMAAVLSYRDDDRVARLVAAHQIASSATQLTAKKLALRYQLVTEDTNLLLVIERADADKTDGMPALHKVRPMVAAGWGATGEVALSAVIRPSSQASFSEDSDAPAYISIKRGDDGSQHLVASVWRVRRPPTEQIDLLATGNVTDYEIPAFLRRPSDDAVSSSSKVEITGYISKVARLLGFPDKRPFATREQLIPIFNAAIARGLNIRLAMRRVTDLNIAPQLARLIAQAAREVGSPLKAWAVYLLWLHDRADAAGKLLPGSLALINHHLREVDPAAITRAQELSAAHEEDPLKAALEQP